MHPELLNAVKERLELGYDHGMIRDELRAAGHSEDAIETVIRQAQADLHPTVSEIPPVTPMTGASGVHENVGEEPQSPATLIGYGELISNSWSLFKQNLFLFTKAILAAGLIFTVLIMVVIGASAGSLGSFAESADLDQLGGAGMVGYFAGFLVMFVAFVLAFRILGFAVLRNLVVRERQAESFVSSLKWTATHIIPVLVLGLMVYLATQFGYALFFFPGVAIAVYLMFASLPLARGESQYMAAMVRSTELVYGRWWGVFGRMLVAGLVAILLLVGGAIGAFILSGAVVMFAGDIFSIIIAPLLIVFAVGYTIGYTTCVSVLLFESLESSLAPNALSEKGKKNTRTFYIIAIALGILAVIFLQGSSALLDELGGAQRDAETASMKMMLLNTRSQAEIYYNQPANNESYLGVCSEIESLVAPYAKYSDCVDAADSWALSATTDGGEQWCVDSESGTVQGAVSLVTGLCANSEAIGGPAAKERANELRNTGSGAAPEDDPDAFSDPFSP